VLAPVEDARDFVERLRSTSNEPCYYLELHGAQHAFEVFSSVRSNSVIEAVVRFLDAVHVAHLRHGEGEPTGEEVEEAVAEQLGDQAAEIVQ
jgi:hypothetical protein